ncbi:MAG: hypothetical protein M3O70_01120, partial [Actinomycetota bacterium]|nr:hypothetical protein [Actinomycetota bacterium]
TLAMNVHHGATSGVLGCLGELPFNTLRRLLRKTHRLHTNPRYPPQVTEVWRPSRYHMVGDAPASPRCGRRVAIALFGIARIVARDRPADVGCPHAL